MTVREYVRDNQGRFAETSGGDLLEALTGQAALDASPAKLVDDGHGPLHPRHKPGTVAWSSGDPGWGEDEAAERLLALESYRAADFAATNKLLRGMPIRPVSQADADAGPAAFQARISRTAEMLDDVMAHSRLTDDVVVFRGTRSGRGVFGDALDGDLSGFEWTEDAFTSTTANPDIAEWFTISGLSMNIRVPAGTGAVSLSGFVRDDGETEEAELLLDRGLRMRVVGDTGPGNPRQIDVEVVRA